MALKHHAAPRFFWIWKPPEKCAPRRPPSAARFASRPRTNANPNFSAQPALVLSACSGPGGQIGASQPRNVVGEGLGLVGHSQASRNRLGLAFRLPVFHLPSRARRPKVAQPARRRPAQPKKALPGRFAPDCGASTTLWVPPLGLAQDFVVWGIQCPWGASLWLLSTGSAGGLG